MNTQNNFYLFITYIFTCVKWVMHSYYYIHFDHKANLFLHSYTHLDKSKW